MEQVENNVNIIGRYLGKNKEGVVIANVFFKPFVFTQASVDKNTYNKWSHQASHHVVPARFQEWKYHSKHSSKLWQ